MAVVESQLAQLIRMDEWLLPEERPPAAHRAERRRVAVNDGERPARSEEREVVQMSQRRHRRRQARIAARALRYFTGPLTAAGDDDAGWQDDVA